MPQEQTILPSKAKATYLATSLSLKEGKKLFTKEELLSYLQKQAPVEGDKPPQLKGGRFN